MHLISNAFHRLSLTGKILVAFTLLGALPLIVIYTVTLTLAWSIPGNPLENPEGRRPSPEVAAQMLRQYDLDSYPRDEAGDAEPGPGLSAVRRFTR